MQMLKRYNCNNKTKSHAGNGINRNRNRNRTVRIALTGYHHLPLKKESRDHQNLNVHIAMKNIFCT